MRKLNWWFGSVLARTFSWLVVCDARASHLWSVCTFHIPILRTTIRVGNGRNLLRISDIATHMPTMLDHSRTETVWSACVDIHTLSITDMGTDDSSPTDTNKLDCAALRVMALRLRMRKVDKFHSFKSYAAKQSIGLIKYKMIKGCVAAWCLVKPLSVVYDDWIQSRILWVFSGSINQKRQSYWNLHFRFINFFDKLLYFMISNKCTYGW